MFSQTQSPPSTAASGGPAGDTRPTPKPPADAAPAVARPAPQAGRTTPEGGVAVPRLRVDPNPERLMGRNWCEGQRIPPGRHAHVFGGMVLRVDTDRLHAQVDRHRFGPMSVPNSRA
jgi:hypothetical protein